MLVTQQQPRWTTHSLCSLRLLSSPPRREAAERPTKTCQGDSSILCHRILHRSARQKCSSSVLPHPVCGCVSGFVWAEVLQSSTCSRFYPQPRTLHDKGGPDAAEGTKCSTQMEGRRAVQNSHGHQAGEGCFQGEDRDPFFQKGRVWKASSTSQTPA